MRLIKQLKNNRQVIFDQGNFDNWCVYVVEANGFRKAPFDVSYFTDLQTLNNLYGENKVYHDFLQIYACTNETINPDTLHLIEAITNTYQEEHQVMIEQWLTVIYAGMIAEENKAFSILKKRIKHLGIHQVLVQGLAPAFAAKFSYGKNWRVLDQVMQQYGI